MQKLDNRYSFVIQSYDRIDSAVKLIIQLSNFSKYGDIYLSDSGGRSKNIFDKEIIKKTGAIIDFKYIDNSKYKNFISHMWNIYSLDLKNMFLFHDDDLVIESSFLNVLNLLIENKEIKYLCSTKRGNSIFLDNFENLSAQEKINQILKIYFLSHNRNCLLITGLFSRHPGMLRKEVDSNFCIDGKYLDVPLLAWIFSQNKSKIFSDSYMKHIDHDSNDNLERSLKDRINLEKFIKKQPGVLNKIIARLIFYGYKEKRKYFLSGILFSLFHPPIWIHLFNKFFNRLLSGS